MICKTCTKTVRGRPHPSGVCTKCRDKAARLAAKEARAAARAAKAAA